MASFRGEAFRKATLKWMPRVEALVASNVAGRSPFFRGKSGIWVGTTTRPPSRRVWRPKLYLCVGAASYWRVVDRLIDLSRAARGQRPAFDFKFYVGPAAFDRPDKLILYGVHPKELRALVAFGRKALPSRGFHRLHHAVSTAELGLEPESCRGIYVGLDPPVGASWRTYRIVCLAWAAAHLEKSVRLPGGRTAWFRRMNVSLDHEGPHSTSPDPRNIPFVRRTWRRILDSLEDVELRAFLLAAYRLR